MILNIDCFKDTLSYIIEHQTLNDNQELNKISLNELYNCKELEIYNKNDIYYALYNLTDIGYIDLPYNQLKNKRILFDINNVTMTGHNFYYGSKNPERWQELKDNAMGIGMSTLEFVTKSIQENAITSTVTEYKKE